MEHPEFTLLGDAVWLDFVNSARGRTPNPPDLLPDAAAFARWTVTQRLLQVDRGPPHEALRELRGRLTALAEALHAGSQPPAGSIAAINELLSGCAGSHRLVRVSGEWRLHFAPARPLSPLEAIARSAAATLADRSVVRAPLRRRGLLPLLRRLLADPEPPVVHPRRCGANLRVERRRGLLR